jgi:hypothetical protein
MSVRLQLLAVLVLCSAVVGCSKGGGPGAGIKVTGKVTHNGSPVSGARVIFTEGKDGDARASGPTAITDDTGEYAVVGVQPGAYKVVIYKLLPAKGSTMPAELLDLEQIEASGVGTHALPKKYSKPTTTTLTAQVDSGANKADFQLTGTVGQ